jgi:hypothetical protein
MTADDLLLVPAYFTHYRPTPEIIAAAARDLGGSPGPREVAARIRAARKATGNPVARELDAATLAEAIAACYGDHRFWDGEDDLTENSGGESWARRQPDGTEVARLESSYATYTVTRRDLPGGVRGYHVTIWWWD